MKRVFFFVLLHFSKLISLEYFAVPKKHAVPRHVRTRALPNTALLGVRNNNSEVLHNCRISRNSRVIICISIFCISMFRVLLPFTRSLSVFVDYYIIYYR